MHTRNSIDIRFDKPTKKDIKQLLIEMKNMIDIYLESDNSCIINDIYNHALGLGIVVAKLYD